MGKTRSGGIELAALAGLLLVFWLANSHFSASLRNTSYASGWVLMVLLLALALCLPGTLLARAHAGLGIVALALFVAHMNFGLPDGGFEILLALLFVAVSLSGIVGRRAAPAAEGEQAVPAWRYVHLSLTWALVGFALIHGILMHAHGLLAWWMG
ncbi:MAG: DUF4405 domain-containing protein [Chrysiogenetes bacterium]|nr:DUF4405 domain-containing protein [Chrysiogenetes bacterium]